MVEKIDVLGRTNFIQKLVKIVELLSDNKQGCCFGINGAWGSGKTFVLEKFEEQLRDIQLEETVDNKYLIFHYDCWKYDYYDEPAIAIVAAMLDAIDKEIGMFSEEVKNAGKLALETVKVTLTKIANELCKNKIGIDLVEIASEILEEHDKEKEKDFDSLYGFKRALEETRNGIQKIANSKTVVVVVDELDRCIPTYSIKVLERLHHIFDGLDNVIVIISMDKAQMEHSIKGIYGEDTKVDAYLRKFISFKMNLDKGSVKEYAEKFATYFSLFDYEDYKDEIEELFNVVLTGLDIRTQERIFNKAEIIHKICAEKDSIEDCSIMTLEIVFMTVAFIMKARSIYWLEDIIHNNYMELEHVKGERYVDRLRDFLQIREGELIDCEDNVRACVTLRGKTYGWLNDIYTITSSLYAEGTWRDFKFEADDIIGQFVQLIDVIDYD